MYVCVLAECKLYNIGVSVCCVCVVVFCLCVYVCLLPECKLYNVGVSVVASVCGCVLCVCVAVCKLY